MITQFKKGVIELCILKIIEEEDLYGFEVINRLHTLDVNDNTIYPILRRLTNQGYFDTYLKESSQGAARKYYKITTEGKKQLKKSKQEWFDFVSNVDHILGGDKDGS